MATNGGAVGDHPVGGGIEALFSVSSRSLLAASAPVTRNTDEMRKRVSEIHAVVLCRRQPAPVPRALLLRREHAPQARN